MNKWRIIGLGLLVFILTGVTACNPLGEGEEVRAQHQRRLRYPSLGLCI